MAIAHVQSTGDSAGGSSTTRTVSFTTSAGNLLLATIYINGLAANIDNVRTSGGTDLTKATDIRVRAGKSISLWYLANAPASTSITATFASAHQSELDVFEFSGAATTSVLAASNTAGDTPSTVTTIGTGTVSVGTNQLALALAGFGNSVTESEVSWSDGSLVEKDFGTEKSAVAYRIFTTGNGSYAPSASWTTGQTASGLIGVFKVGDTAVELTAQGITLGALTLDEGAVTQTHVLTADGITLGALTLDEGSVTQTHVLTAQDATLGALTLDEGSVTQTHVLTADGITLGALTLDEGSVSLEGDLTAQGITLGALTLDEGSVTQTHVLTADGITLGALVLDVGAVTQTHVLTADGITLGALVLDVGAVTQTHVLTADGITLGALVLDTGSVSEGDLVFIQSTALTASPRWVGIRLDRSWSGSNAEPRWTATTLTPQ